jgi:glycopeptide antibiotics resistance protein
MDGLSRRIRITVVNHIVPLSFIAALLIIIYATLTPFHFHFDYLSLSDYLVEFTFGKKDPFDIIRNILLFLPFGFFLGLILDRRGWSKARVFFTIFLSGLLLTLTVESLQQFLPYRQASIYDLIGNTLGAMIGLVFYRIWLNRHAAVKRIQLAVSDPFKVLAVLAIYILFLLLLASSMTANARIFGWDKSYHLMLGNEWTANRPWRGAVFDLEIFNEALDIDSARQILNSPELALKFSASLQAYYQLTGGAPFRDLVGKLPDLVWEKEGEISR